MKNLNILMLECNSNLISLNGDLELFLYKPPLRKRPDKKPQTGKGGAILNPPRNPPIEPKGHDQLANQHPHQSEPMFRPLQMSIILQKPLHLTVSNAFQ
jgi:hypothetical protein